MWKADNKRKSILCIIAAVLVCGICCLLLWRIFRGNDKGSDVVIIGEESFLSDFEVIGETVHIYCVVSLKNEGDDPREVKLTGDFTKETDGGLLKERSLEAHFIDTDTDSITVEGNSDMKYVKIEFTGEFAGNARMSTRNLPPVRVVDVGDDL